MAAVAANEYYNHRIDAAKTYRTRLFSAEEYFHSRIQRTERISRSHTQDSRQQGEGRKKIFETKKSTEAVRQYFNVHARVIHGARTAEGERDGKSGQSVHAYSKWRAKRWV